MDDLAALCAQKTDLTPTDIERLSRLAESLQYISDLNGCDAFIDCIDRTGAAFVAAQSTPCFYSSRYKTSVVGQDALRENEPAVYHCFERSAPVHDTRAMTQENLIVQQDVAPIENEAGRVIGVMVCERDISREASLERKLDVSERERQELFNHAIAAQDAESASDKSTVYVREAYHRIKNDLQMLASTCNVRMRQAKEEETRLRLFETAQQILTIASFHDLLTVWGTTNTNRQIAMNVLLR